MSKRKPPYAGLRRWYPNRLTGGFVGVYDGEPGGYDTDAGRWQTVCEEHGQICSHQTLDVALAFGHQPEEWCEACMILDGQFPQECAVSDRPEWIVAAEY